MIREESGNDVFHFPQIHYRLQKAAIRLFATLSIAGGYVSGHDDLIKGIRQKDPWSLGRLARMIDDGLEGKDEALARLHAMGGHSRVVGITGPPGAGKSTLISSLIGEGRKQGRTIAVLAVDPTSPYSGGAVLGDRVRMQEHATDPGVYIRSLATRGHMGGLSRSVQHLVRSEEHTSELQSR